jgi:hypothetical protein
MANLPNVEHHPGILWNTVALVRVGLNGRPWNDRCHGIKAMNFPYYRIDVWHRSHVRQQGLSGRLSDAYNLLVSFFLDILVRHYQYQEVHKHRVCLQKGLYCF